MNIHEAKSTISKIQAKDKAKDHEAAHDAEDLLLAHFCRTVARDGIKLTELKGIAKLIVTHLDGERGPRWTACKLESSSSAELRDEREINERTNR